MNASTFCTAASTERQYAKDVCRRLGIEWRLKRKIWEIAFVCETLESAGLLQHGKRGIGFGVGVERLPGFFAAAGCEIVATDKQGGGWFKTNKQRLNCGLCDDAAFDRLVTYRTVDMNWLPDDLAGFDFCWSCCSLDHLGSIRLAKRFIYRSLDCLKPGGVAVHTGEYGPLCDWRSVDNSQTVVLTRLDLEESLGWLHDRGHAAEFDFEPKLDERDKLVLPLQKDHLRLKIRSVESTSFGIAIRKSA